MKEESNLISLKQSFSWNIAIIRVEIVGFSPQNTIFRD